MDDKAFIEYLFNSSFIDERIQDLISSYADHDELRTRLLRENYDFYVEHLEHRIEDVNDEFKINDQLAEVEHGLDENHDLTTQDFNLDELQRVNQSLYEFEENTPIILSDNDTQSLDTEINESTPELQLAQDDVAEYDLSTAIDELGHIFNDENDYEEIEIDLDEAIVQLQKEYDESVADGSEIKPDDNEDNLSSDLDIHEVTDELGDNDNFDDLYVVEITEEPPEFPDFFEEENESKDSGAVNYQEQDVIQSNAATLSEPGEFPLFVKSEDAKRVEALKSPKLEAEKHGQAQLASGFSGNQKLVQQKPDAIATVNRYSLFSSDIFSTAKNNVEALVEKVENSALFNRNSEDSDIKDNNDSKPKSLGIWKGVHHKDIDKYYEKLNQMFSENDQKNGSHSDKAISNQILGYFNSLYGQLNNINLDNDIDDRYDFNEFKEKLNQYKSLNSELAKRFGQFDIKTNLGNQEDKKVDELSQKINEFIDKIISALENKIKNNEEFAMSM